MQIDVAEGRCNGRQKWFNSLVWQLFDERKFQGWLWIVTSVCCVAANPRPDGLWWRGCRAGCYLREPVSSPLCACTWESSWTPACCGIKRKFNCFIWSLEIGCVRSKWKHCLEVVLSSKISLTCSWSYSLDSVRSLRNGDQLLPLRYWEDWTC